MSNHYWYYLAGFIFGSITAIVVSAVGRFWGLVPLFVGYGAFQLINRYDKGCAK